MSFRVLLITPPMVQFNAPYAATPALTAFLCQDGIDTVQADLSLELALGLFSRRGVEQVVAEIKRSGHRRTAAVRWLASHAARCVESVEDAVRFLQSGDAESARRIVAGSMPAGPRSRLLRELDAAGIDPAAEGREAHARFLASLFLDDLADAVREGADKHFGLSRYAERLAASAPSFTPLCRALKQPPGLVSRMLDALTLELLDRVKPDLVGITIPFPGNVYAAFRIARQARAWNVRVRTAAGGGFVNTELRTLSDARVFDFFDFVVYDDGEQPLQRIVRHLEAGAPVKTLIRTRLRRGSQVVYVDADGPPLRHRERPAPRYEGLTLSRYVGMTETLNPMHRLWTERRWMRLALAHGCYWRRCAFCDTGLDYIARFDPADAETVVRWIEQVRTATGERGFHFVDEAAPPSLLRRVAETLIERKLAIAWWANIRFERTFTPELARLLARSGCLAVTGGLECAEARLLCAMDKGVRLPEAARAMHAFAGAGILVHAYLMHGFPRQTVQETVDGLEAVRQLFEAGCLQSAYWHRFALTVHSPIFRQRRAFGIRAAERRPGGFAENEVPFSDGMRVDRDRLGRALHKAVYNYMYGAGIETDVRHWFDRRVPRPRLPPHAVREWLRA